MAHEVHHEVQEPRRGSLGHFLLPAAAALCLFPFVSAGLGLLLGLVLALACGNPYLDKMRKATHTLLALSVVGLGAGMDLRVVARVGAHGVLYTVLGIATALALGALLTRLLRVSRDVGTLITVGTAICGGSAIAAVVPVLRPKQHEVSVALAIVFLLNAIALFVFPPIGHAVGLTDAQFGLWSALAIHDTSSVVGAAVAWGGAAVAIATTVKLARALWIVPLTIAIGHWHHRANGATAKGKPARPWFIAGFIAAA
ncbi:MAG TPA: putative sulfate exporter family transporter, partial [Ktedonobacterales bacterium]|nr:putative sulfate exporter family transporter [Ktedonobacterales bacterium]